MIAHYREIHGPNNVLMGSLEHCRDTEKPDNGNNPHQIQKKRSGSGEPRPCTKRFKGSTFKDIGDDVEFIDLTEN